MTITYLATYLATPIELVFAYKYKRGTYAYEGFHFRRYDLRGTLALARPLDATRKTGIQVVNEDHTPVVLPYLTNHGVIYIRTEKPGFYRRLGQKDIKLDEKRYTYFESSTP